MSVLNLFLKPARGKAMRAVKAFTFTPAGIVGNDVCQPLRQVLVTSHPISQRLGLRPGQLRENIVLDVPDLYELESGAVIRIGVALIRLTFHCEPCGRVLGKTKIKNIIHQRGFLGYFVNSGRIKIGDRFSVTDLREEPIPYDVRSRLKWYFANKRHPVTATKLVHDLGLSNSYVRALPSIIKKIPEIDDRLIVFVSSFESRAALSNSFV